MSELHVALLAARKAMKPLIANSLNTFTNSKYPDLAAVLAVINPPLMDAGILLEQYPNFADQTVTIDTMVTHAETGQQECHTFSLPITKSDPQSVGTGISYARRYSLVSIFALAAEDDDGNATSQRSAELAKRKPASPRATPVDFNGQPASPAAAPPAEAVVMPTEAARKAFHAMGTKIYGDEWDTKRAELVSWVTDQRTPSSKELTKAEMARLSAGMEAKLAQLAQPDAKLATGKA